MVIVSPPGPICVGGTAVAPEANSRTPDQNALRDERSMGLFEKDSLVRTLEELTNPSSNDKTYGFSINIGSKFVLRANKYETRAINSRAGQSAIFAQRGGRVDFERFAGNNDAISLQRQARVWLTAQGLTGIANNTSYDAWTPARAYQHYHGAIRILTETASAQLASPTRTECRVTCLATPKVVLPIVPATWVP